MSTRRGGIPGPESRTGLMRPMMSEAEFERRLAASSVDALLAGAGGDSDPAGASTGIEPEPAVIGRTSPQASSSRTRSTRGKPAAKPRRVQRMFAIEEDLDRKLWLYAIHVGKDRSDVVNDLLRPVVASMVLYDSRDRRASASRSSVESSEAEPQTRDLAEAG